MTFRNTPPPPPPPGPPPASLPSPGTGEVEYEDSATVDATITATFPLGGSPKVQVSRKFGF